MLAVEARGKRSADAWSMHAALLHSRVHEFSRARTPRYLDKEIVRAHALQPLLRSHAACVRLPRAASVTHPRPPLPRAQAVDIVEFLRQRKWRGHLSGFGHCKRAPLLTRLVGGFKLWTGERSIEFNAKPPPKPTPDKDGVGGEAKAEAAAGEKAAAVQFVLAPEEAPVRAPPEVARE